MCASDKITLRNEGNAEFSISGNSKTIYLLFVRTLPIN